MLTGIMKYKAVKICALLALLTALAIGLAYATSPNYFRNPNKMTQVELEEYAHWICSLEKPNAERYLVKALRWTGNEIDKQKVAAIIASECHLEILHHSALKHVRFTDEGVGGSSYSWGDCLAFELLSRPKIDVYNGPNMFVDYRSSSPDDPFYDAVLSRLESVQENGSINDKTIVGDVFGALAGVAQWTYTKLSTPEDIERRTQLVTAYLATADRSPELVAAQDRLIVTIMRNGGGPDSFFTRNPKLIKGAVGDRSIDLLQNWQDPERAEQAIQLMQALWRLEYSSNPKKLQDLTQYGALQAAVRTAISAVSEHGSPQQQADLREVMLAETPAEALTETDVRALEESVLQGLTDLTPDTLTILTMDGQRTPSAQLKEKILAKKVGTDPATLVAMVREWGDALPPILTADVRSESILAVYRALERRDISKRVLPWHQQAVDALFGVVEDKETPSYLRGYAARLLIITFARDEHLAQKPIQLKLEALVTLQTRRGKTVLPETDWEIFSEVLRRVHLLNPTTTIYRDYHQHYEILTNEYKCIAAKSAVQAPLAPGAAEYWIKAYTDPELRALRSLRSNDLIRDTTNPVRVQFRLPESKQLRETVETYVEDKKHRKRILNDWDKQKK